jgi:hypothetical protein
MRALSLLALLVSGCATVPPTTPAQTFFDRLGSLCGQAFEGRIVSAPVAPDASFAGKRLVMHVRECSADTIRVPFHVGDDRSRTWVVTRTDTGLRLKHDHRHEDGSEDKVTQYGGDSAAAGTSTKQDFPADAFTRDLLVRENNPAGIDNVWTLEFTAAPAFAYQLRRPNRHFRVEFDLTRPVSPPPPPWGAR